MKGVRSEIWSKSSIESGMLSSCAMAMRWSTALVDAAGCGDGGDGVVDGVAREDVARLDLLARELHDHAAGFAAGGVLLFRHRGDAGELDGRDAEELAGHGHGVGGELAAAGAGAGAGCGFDGFELVVVDACRRRASRWLRRRSGW